LNIGSIKHHRFKRWAGSGPMRRIRQHLVMQWFKRTVALHAGAAVLEVGCGRGVGGRLISETYRPHALYLLDLDLKSVERAERRLNGLQVEHIYLCVGDVVRLPFRDGTLDAVFGFGFLHHVPAWRDGLAEVVRVLKYGGVYFMEEYYPGLYQNFITKRILAHPVVDRFNSRQLHQTFQNAGLSLTHTFELKRMGILGVGVKADAQSISCKRHEDACRVVLD
jgi:ubiquinone/menaquinone biosynthesis C-methylase UbiE